MVSIQPINFNRNIYFTGNDYSSDNRRDNLQDGAVAGGAAGGGYKMFKNAKNASKVSADTARRIKQGKDVVLEATNVIKEPVNQASGLFKSFKTNCKRYGELLFTRIQAVKTSKFIKPIIDNKLVKAGCGVVGGVLAGCVLLSGLGELYTNSAKIVDHYTDKVSNFANSAVDDIYRFREHLS